MEVTDTTTTTPKSLKQLLAEQLPKDVPFTFYHYSTPPSKSSALFSAPPHGKSERTYCESHFLAASIAAPKTAASSKGSELPEELLILAIEVLVYSTQRLTTLFVSKADSTGYLSERQLPRSQAGSPLKAICGTFVSWLARERQREGKKLVISLFARAQDQYLFPASIENKNKHVLDDRGLVKWWCKVLDPIIWQYKAEEQKKPFTERLVEGEKNGDSEESGKAETTAKGYLVIPGFEPYDTMRYTPLPPPPATTRRWSTTHPLLQIAPNPAAPPRCLVPHFPDDPKSRFLDELDEELPDRGTDAMVADGGTPSRSNGQWKSVKTLDQFWEFMAFRQECSSGRIVGFIWVVITPPPALQQIPEEDTTTIPASQESFSQQQPLSQLESQETTTTTASPRRPKPTANKRRREAATKHRYGPIPLVLPRIKSSSSTLSSTSTASASSHTAASSSQGGKPAPASSTPYYTWPVSSRGTFCFSVKNYARALEILLHQSFGTRKAAARSTRKWREEIGVLGGGVDGWGWVVVGEKEESRAGGKVGGNVVPVTTVMGVRKKRKNESTVVTEQEVTAAVAAAATAAGEEGKKGVQVQVLSEGVVRKKVKVDGGGGSTVKGEGEGVNTLAAGLVRKESWLDG